jgi:hypothetical protein
VGAGRRAWFSFETYHQDSLRVAGIHLRSAPCSSLPALKAYRLMAAGRGSAHPPPVPAPSGPSRSIPGGSDGVSAWPRHRRSVVCARCASPPAIIVLLPLPLPLPLLLLSLSLSLSPSPSPSPSPSLSSLSSSSLSLFLLLPLVRCLPIPRLRSLASCSCVCALNTRAYLLHCRVCVKVKLGSKIDTVEQDSYSSTRRKKSKSQEFGELTGTHKSGREEGTEGLRLHRCVGLQLVGVTQQALRWR